MPIVVLLDTSMMLGMLLLLMCRVVLKIIHQRHTPPTGSSIDTGVLALLVALVKHAVY